MLYVVVGMGNYFDIFIVDVEGKYPQKIARSRPPNGGVMAAAVSPDGKTVYYRADVGALMSPIDCYYSHSCTEIPAELADQFPYTWDKDFTPRWTGTYRTFYEKYGTPVAP